MKKNRSLYKLIAAIAMLLVIPESYASLSFTFERINDTTIYVTGTGQLEAVDASPSNANTLYFDDTFQVPLAGIVNQPLYDFSTTSSLSLGAAVLRRAVTMSQDFDWSGASSGWYFYSLSGDFKVGDALSAGGVELDLDTISSNPVFKTVGSAGDVYWGGANANHPGKLVGQWEMVAPGNVPVPPAVLFFGSGIAGLIGIRRRKQKQA